MRTLLVIACLACVGCQTARTVSPPCPPPEIIRVAVEHIPPQPPPSTRPDLPVFALRPDASDDVAAMAYAETVLILMNEVERLNQLLDGYRMPAK